jgi:hypothetical protein
MAKILIADLSNAVTQVILAVNTGANNILAQKLAPLLVQTPEGVKFSCEVIFPGGLNAITRTQVSGSVENGISLDNGGEIENGGSVTNGNENELGAELEAGASDEIGIEQEVGTTIEAGIENGVDNSADTTLAQNDIGNTVESYSYYNDD